jgi:hypothetical protein
MFRSGQFRIPPGVTYRNDLWMNSFCNLCLEPRFAMAGFNPYPITICHAFPFGGFWVDQYLWIRLYLPKPGNIVILGVKIGEI